MYISLSEIQSNRIEMARFKVSNSVRNREREGGVSLSKALREMAWRATADEGNGGCWIGWWFVCWQFLTADVRKIV